MHRLVLLLGVTAEGGFEGTRRPDRSSASAARGCDGIPLRGARMQAVVCDLFGTLFQLEPLGKHLEAAGVPASSLKLWFARILRDAWALEVAGQYRPFREVAASALGVMIVEQGGTPEQKKIDQVGDAFAMIAPY